jgi:hypothetical protein
MRNLTLAILDEIVRETRAAGAQPAFAYLPVWGELVKTGLAMTARERFFFSYCRERGIQSMYLQRVFLEAQRAGVKLQRYGHWTAVEHRIAAEGIAAYVVEKKLLPEQRGRDSLPAERIGGEGLRDQAETGVEGGADAQRQQQRE